MTNKTPARTTVGSLALRRILEARTRAAIAELLDVDASLVSRIANGQRSPSEAMRVKMAGALAIPIVAWNEGPPPAQDGPKATPANADDVARVDDAASPVLGAYQRAREHVRTTKRILDEAIAAKASPRELAALAGAHSGAIRVLGTERTMERTMLESDEFRRCIRRIETTLRTYPDAARAIAAELREAESELRAGDPSADDLPPWPSADGMTPVTSAGQRGVTAAIP